MNKRHLSRLGFTTTPESPICKDRDEWSAFLAKRVSKKATPVKVWWFTGENFPEKAFSDSHSSEETQSLLKMSKRFSKQASLSNTNISAAETNDISCEP